LKFSLQKFSIVRTELERSAHGFKIFAFLLVHERTGFALEPLQLGAPVTTLERLIAAFFSQLFPFSIAVPHFVALY
jgi:hypothetical protein